MHRALHLVVAALRADADVAAIDAAVDLARDMRVAPGVEAVLIARAPQHVVVGTLLDEPARLDAFAESEAHMAFVVRGLSAITSGVWSASVETPPGEAPTAGPGVLWAFALLDDDALFDWQARRLLERVAALPGTAAVGATVEDRDRHRVAGVVAVSQEEAAAFRGALDALRLQDASLAPLLREAMAAEVEVVRP